LKSSAIYFAAYGDGAHIDLRYSAEGEIVSEGDGPSVVEYMRCGGWEWVPDAADERAHIVCTDGAITNIEKGGKVIAKAVVANGTTGVMVHAQQSVAEDQIG